MTCFTSYLLYYTLMNPWNVPITCVCLCVCVCVCVCVCAHARACVCVGYSNGILLQLFVQSKDRSSNKKLPEIT